MQILEGWSITADRIFVNFQDQCLLSEQTLICMMCKDASDQEPIFRTTGWNGCCLNCSFTYSVFLAQSGHRLPHCEQSIVWPCLAWPEAVGSKWGPSQKETCFRPFQAQCRLQLHHFVDCCKDAAPTEHAHTPLFRSLQYVCVFAGVWFCVYLLAK